MRFTRDQLSSFTVLAYTLTYGIGINPCVCWYMTNTFSRGMYQLHPDAKRRDVIYMPRLNVFVIYQQTQGFIAIISPKQQRLSRNSPILAGTLFFASLIITNTTPLTTLYNQATTNALYILYQTELVFWARSDTSRSARVTAQILDADNFYDHVA